MAGLNDQNKRFIKRGFDGTAAKGDEALEYLRERGPAFWIDGMFPIFDLWAGVPEAAADKQNLLDNRDEAERYLAGLMGMM